MREQAPPGRSTRHALGKFIRRFFQNKDSFREGPLSEANRLSARERSNKPVELAQRVAAAEGMAVGLDADAGALGSTAAIGIGSVNAAPGRMEANRAARNCFNCALELWPPVNAEAD
jgi:hypothetical protein